MWLLVFFLTPVIEMYLLIEVAGYIDVWPTIFLVMLTAVIGVALLKRQGFATLTRGLNRLDQGEVPAQEMAEGILLAVAGALLVTPGFVTDSVGFVLLFPPTRARIAERMLKYVKVRGLQGGTTFTYRPQPSHPAQDRGDGPVTLEGEYEPKDR